MTINFDSRYLFNHQFNLMSKLDSALEKEEYLKAKSLLLEWHEYLTDFLKRVKSVYANEKDKDKEVAYRMNNALSESIDLFLSYIDLLEC